MKAVEIKFRKDNADTWDSEKHLWLRHKKQRGLNMGKDFLRVVTMELKRKFTVIIFNKVSQKIPLTL